MQLLSVRVFGLVCAWALLLILPVRPIHGIFVEVVGQAMIECDGMVI